MATKLSRGEAIYAINPNAEYVIKNETVEGYDSIDWVNGTTPISDNEIDTKLAELQAQHDSDIVNKQNLKISAKAKLIAGQPLTEEEADTLVL